MKKRSRQLLLTTLTILLIIQVALPVLFFIARDRLLFLPRNDVTAESRLGSFDPELDAIVVEIARPDGRRLSAYDACPAGRRTAGGPVVLFLHGNGGDIAMRAPRLAQLVRDTGLRWVMPDYSGYGGNPGSPSEAEVGRDGLAVFDELVASGVAAGRIVLFGESLGGAVALAVAAERDPAGVALQSTFASLPSMARELYPWLPLVAVLSRGAFPSVERIAALEVPVLLVHGERDRIIPIGQGEELLAAAPEGTELIRIADAGHNDLFEVAGPEYALRLGALFRTWTGD